MNPATAGWTEEHASLVKTISAEVQQQCRNSNASIQGKCACRMPNKNSNPECNHT